MATSTGSCAGLDRRVRHRARRARRRSLRADRPKRGDLAPLARPAAGHAGDRRPSGQRGVHRLAGRPRHVRALAPPRSAWFRSADLDQIEQRTGQEWDSFIAPLPNPHYPKPNYAVSLRRSRSPPRFHADAEWGAIAAGFERGLSAYCWPREAVWVGDTLARLGHPEMSRSVYRWLATVRGRNRAFPYWFQKYTIDGGPEWETPAVDQTAIIPWGLERHYHRTGDLAFVAASWPMIEQAAQVCTGQSGHPGPTPDRGVAPDQLGGDLGPPLRRLSLLRMRRSWRDSAPRPGLARLPRPERGGGALGGDGRPDLGTGHPRRSVAERARPHRSRARPFHRCAATLDPARALDESARSPDRAFDGPRYQHARPGGPSRTTLRGRPQDGPDRRGHPEEQRDPGEPEPPDPLVAGTGPAGAQLRAGRVRRVRTSRASPRSGWRGT